MNKRRGELILEKVIRIAKPFFLLIGVGIIALMIKKIGVVELASLIRKISPFYVSLALAVWLLNLVVAGLRFRSLSAPQLQYGKVFEVLLLSYLLNYASAVQGAGVGARVGLLRGEKVAVSQSLAGSGAEVLLDLLFTATVALIFAGYVGMAKSGLGEIHPLPFLMGGFVGIAVICCILVLSRRGGFWGRFVVDLKMSLVLKKLPKNFLWTAVIWALSGMGFYLILRAVGEVINPFLAISAMAVGFVIGFVSLVPGGLGVRDFSWAYVVSLGGVPLPISVGAALFLRFIYIITVAVLAILMVGLRKKK